MIQKHSYWYFKEALTKRTCEHILEYGKSKQLLIGQTGATLNPEKLKNKKIKKQRHSNVAWLDDTWIYKEIIPYVKEANKNSGWNFEFDCAESCQFTKYGPGQFYDWHADSWEEPYDKPGTLQHNKIRKISVTCQLTNPSEYVGGELEFLKLNESKGKTIKYKCEEAKSIGSIVVFPSYLVHRVTPVISGVRYSLVIWNLGYPFK